MKYAKIIATARYTPENIVSNDDLAKIVDTSDAWISQRTGILQRHIIAEDEDVTSMATVVARQVLQDGNMQAKELDAILVATCSAKQIFPAVACQVQANLGVSNCLAFDLQAACSGFIYGLTVAKQFIATGACKNILLIGSEAMSQVVDWQDRSTCVLFGDGAGAILLTASSVPGVISTHWGSDSQYVDALSLYKHTPNKAEYLTMQGGAIFKLAVKSLSSIAKEALDFNGLRADDIDWLIPHQANMRIIQSTVEKLALSLDKVVVTVDKHANTSAASIPMALDVAIKDGRIKSGQRLLLQAFGGGLTWGSALLNY